MATLPWGLPLSRVHNEQGTRAIVECDDGPLTCIQAPCCAYCVAEHSIRAHAQMALRARDAPAGCLLYVGRCVCYGQPEIEIFADCRGVSRACIARSYMG